MLPNTTLIIIYSALLILSVFLLVFALLQDKKRNLTRNTVFLAAMLVGWQVGQILYYSSTNYAWSFFLYDIDIPFVALTSLALFIFVLRFYSIALYKNPAVVVILCIVPIITTILCLTPAEQAFFRSSLEILTTTPVHTISTTRGLWFWIHAAYCYVLTITAFIVALIKSRRVPKVYRPSSGWLIIGIIASLAGNVLVLTEISPAGLDPTLIGATICMFFLYFATRNHQGLDFLNHAREEIFNEAVEGVIIVDDQGIIINKNKVAEKLLKVAGVDITEASYDSIQKMLIHLAVHFEHVTEDNGGIDYYFDIASRQHIYNIREKEITDKRGKTVSTVVICSNVTENRLIIKRLEREAGIDALTGLINRRTMERALEEYDRLRYYPLSVIMADLNFLKTVNDTFGHQQGDLYLRAAAEILISSCPPNAHIARTGGDEFMMLIPNYSLQQAGMLMSDINARAENTKGYLFDLSISLGAFVKTNETQLLSDVIKQADAYMYMDKRQKHAIRK